MASNGRRGRGEGSIYWDEARERWVAAITLPGGQRKVFRAKTRNEVSRATAKALHELEEGIEPTSNKVTVKAYLADWLEVVRAKQRAPRTLEGYQGNVERYLVPALGRIPLSRLKPEDVEKMLRGMEERGLSARTRQYALTTLRIALRVAARRGYVSRNVASLVDAPTICREPVVPLTVEESKTFLAACKGHREGSLYTVTLGLGLRRGEVAGLRWSDVDLEEGQLWVRQTLQRQKGKGLVVSEPKSRSSRRPLALPGFVVEGFRQQKRDQAEQRLTLGPDWQDTGFVFTMENGRPVCPDYLSKQFPRFLSEVFTRCPKCEDGGHVIEEHCDKCGEKVEVKVPTISLHGLRHSAASLLFAQGCSLKLVQTILGHAQLSLTADLYTHLLPGANREAATAMESLFGGEG